MQSNNDIIMFLITLQNDTEKSASEPGTMPQNSKSADPKSTPKSPKAPKSPEVRR